MIGITNILIKRAVSHKFECKAELPKKNVADFEIVN